MDVADRVVSGPSVPAGRRDARVLRATFSREDRRVVCELGLTGDDSQYEPRIHWAAVDVPDVTVERFNDAVPAFQRQAAVERLLLQDGWSLHDFQCLQVPRAAKS